MVLGRFSLHHDHAIPVPTIGGGAGLQLHSNNSWLIPVGSSCQCFCKTSWCFKAECYVWGPCIGCQRLSRRLRPAAAAGLVAC